MRRNILVPVVGLVLFGLSSLQASTLTVEPITWDVVGLDSNNVSVGPNLYLVGVRVKNTDTTTATNVVGTFSWDDGLDLFTGNAYINLQPSSLTTITVPSLAAGKSTDFYFNVLITRDSNAYDKVRKYRVTVTQNGDAPVVSPTPRQIYVERLISQNRNGVDSMTGPSTVYVGGTYQYTVVYHTATQGYDQLMAFAGFQNNPFQILSVNTTYAAPAGATNDIVYADAGGWDNDPNSPSYRSIIGPNKYGDGKAGGGPITSVYTIKVNSLAPGNNPIVVSNTINDHSGSSYHYNSDFGSGNGSITVTVLNGNADLGITKTLTSGSQTATNGNVTFRLTLTNAATSNVAATNIQVLDALPVGLTFVSATAASGSYNSTSGVWTVPTLAVGGSTTLDITASVSRAVGTTITNVATITALDQNDPNPSNNTSSLSLGDQITMNLGKVTTSFSGQQGTNAVFTLTLTNTTAGKTATGVKVSDVLNPANFVFVSASASSGSYDSATGVWNVGSVVNGTPATLTLTARVVNTGTLTNTATITAVDQPNNGTASAASNVVSSYPAANLALVSTSEAFTTGANIAIGEVARLRLEFVVPKGATTGDQFVHTLPAGMSYLGNPRVAFVSNIPAAATYTCRFQQIQNLTTFVANGGTNSNGFFDPGTNKVNGDTGANPQLDDLILVTGQTDARQNGIYRALGNGANADWERTTYSPVNGDVVNVTTGTTSTTAGNFVLQAKVYPNGANTTASLNVTDLVYTAAGGPITSSTLSGAGLTVNGDESTLASITPTFAMTSGVPAAGATGAITFAFGNLTNPDPDTTKEFVVLEFNALVANVATNIAGTVLNNSFQAQVTTPASTNTSNTVALTVVQPSITATKTASVTSLTRGQTVSYTLTFAMSGAANTTNACDIVISDPLPSAAPNALTLNTASVAWTNSAGVAGITNTTAGNNVGFTITSMTPGDFIQITYTATVAAGATIGASIANNASLLYTSLPGTGTAGGTNTTGSNTPGGSGAADGERNSSTAPALPNNLRATASLSLPVAVTSELQITNRVNGVVNLLANAGDVVTFLLTAKNNGPDAATNVVVTNLLPAGLTYLAGQTLSPSAGTIGGFGSTTTWNVGNLASGASATLSIQATVMSSTTNLVDKATITGSEFDPITNNNTAYSSVTPIEADLAITDTVNLPSPTVGQTVTYTVRLVNNGFNNASNVTVSVPLPGWLTSPTATPSAGTSYSSGVWTLPAVALSTTSAPNIQTLTITGVLNTAASSTHTVTITRADQYDPDSSNNQASVTIPQVAPTAVNDAYSAIRDTTLFISAPGVLANDSLFGATIASYGTSGTQQTTAGLPTATASNGSVSLAANGNFSYTPPAGFTGTDTFQYIITNAVGSSTGTVTITVVASLSPPAAVADAYATTQNVALNVAATGVLGNDTLNSATIISYGASSGSEQTALGSSTATAHGTISLNATGAFTYTPTTNYAGTDTFKYIIKNAAGSSTGTVTVTITGSADLEVTKTVDVSTPAVGANVVFTITLKNNGPDVATNIRVTDVLPAGLTYVSDDQATYDPGASDNVWNVASLANGASVVLKVTATAATAGLKTNTATISGADQNDPASGNNSASANVNPGAVTNANLEVTKTVDVPNQSVGQNVVFTITLKNNGPDAATNVALTDALPAGLTYVSDDQATYDPGTGDNVLNVANLANGASVVLKVTATVATAGPKTNTASVTASDQGDSDSTNNSASATVTPPLPTLAINDVTVTETDTGTVNATFTVTLSVASNQAISVNYATADNTATAGADYVGLASAALNFAAGETTKTITVVVNGDTLNEVNETYFVNLSGATNATISDNQGLGTITDNDAVPSLSINDITVTETDTGTVNATFTVTLSAASGQAVAVNYATANNTATAGATADYVAIASTALNFAAGETTKTITVVVNGDTLNEVNETYFVNLSGATNATISDNQGLGTITDNDGVPSLSINDVTVTETDSGTVNATFTVTLSAASGEAVAVNYATANNTATAGADYVAIASTALNFAAGETSKTLTVTVNSDTLNEVNETYFVNLSGAANATISDNQGLGAITDNDATPSLSINDVTVTEGNSGTVNATFTISLSTASGQAVSVNYATANNTATSGSDYVAQASTAVNFAAGETSKTVTILVNGDTVSEVNETFFVNLSGASNATISDNQGIGTITDDDGTPSLSINDVTVTETDSGTVNATFTVTLSAASGQVVSVNYATANNTATAGADYVAIASTALNFAVGETTKTLTVLVNGDTLNEINETFFVNLSGAVNATISDNQGLGTITDNDATPSLSINDITVTETDAGTVNASFTVTLSAASGQAVSLNYATANNTATAGADYVAIASTALNFAAGETTKTLTVLVNGDTLDEINETFFVNLSGAVNATISDNQGLGTITDNDATPSLSINDITVTETDAGTVNATFTVTLSAASGQSVSLNYATANNTATAGADYVALASTALNFAAGETTKTLTVLVNGDTLNEIAETFFVNLSGATNATISDNQGLGTITDNDATPSLSINDITVTETDAGTVNATFTVTLSAASGQAVSVNYATANNTATAGADYVAIASTVLNFVAGETTKTVTVLVNGDTLSEVAETFFVNLSGATNATISDNQGVGTITDNDATPTLSINDVTVAEGNSGTVNATFTVTLSAPSGQTVTVNFATANNTATGADYVAQTGTLTFAPGETTKPITIAVNGDLITENSEQFFVNLSGAGNAAFAKNQGVGTITDNDPAADLSIIKTADNLTPQVNGAVNYTIIVSNAGPATATNVQVTDNLPSGLTLLGTTPTQGAYAVATGIWTVGSIEAGKSATLLVSTRVVVASTILNIAQITRTDLNDPTPNDQTSTATITATPVGGAGGGPGGPGGAGGGAGAPNDPTATGTFTPMSTSCFGAKMNFAKKFKDAMVFLGDIDNPEGIDPAGQEIFWNLAGWKMNCKLNSKGVYRSKTLYLEIRKMGDRLRVSMRVNNEDLQSQMNYPADITVKSLVMDEQILKMKVGGVLYGCPLSPTYSAVKNRYGKIFNK